VYFLKGLTALVHLCLHSHGAKGKREKPKAKKRKVYVQLGFVVGA
jgi:hypothetical protein